MTMTLGRPTPAKPKRPAPPVDLSTLDADELMEGAEHSAGRPVPGLRLTERQFVAWSMNRLDAEWVDGEVIVLAPVSDAHDDLNMWLSTLIYQYVEHSSAGVVRHNMFVRFPRHRRRRVPDLMFIAARNKKRVRQNFIEGPPDLVVEIVSPDSQNRDRRDKYAEYESAGVREYWIIDPLSRTADVYALRGRKYRAVVPADDGRLDSAVLRGLYLRPAWLFGKSRPKVARVLKELGVRG